MTPRMSVVITHILEDEGGIADVGDGMGVTRFGQTPQWLAQHGLMPPATQGEAALNYEAWLIATRIAEVIAWDVDVGYLVSDWAVHSGNKVAISALQHVLGTEPDGVIGPKTLEAMVTHKGALVARKLLAERVEYIGDLLAAKQDKNGNPIDRRKWSRGWLNRLARQIRTLP